LLTSQSSHPLERGESPPEREREATDDERRRALSFAFAHSCEERERSRRRKRWGECREREECPVSLLSLSRERGEWV